MAVVEVVPLVAGTAPVIVGGGIVGTVVGVLGLLVESTGLGVLDKSLGVKVGGLLSVEDGAHSVMQKLDMSEVCACNEGKKHKFHDESSI